MDRFAYLPGRGAWAGGHRPELLIFDAVGGSPPGMKALRILADARHKASRMHLGRRLAREGRLDELRQRADSGDEYAQHWLVRH